MDGKLCTCTELPLVEYIKLGEYFREAYTPESRHNSKSVQSAVIYKDTKKLIGSIRSAECFVNCVIPCGTRCV